MFLYTYINNKKVPLGFFFIAAYITFKNKTVPNLKKKGKGRKKRRLRWLYIGKNDGHIL